MALELHVKVGSVNEDYGLFNSIFGILIALLTGISHISLP